MILFLSASKDWPDSARLCCTLLYDVMLLMRARRAELVLDSRKIPTMASAAFTLMFCVFFLACVKS